MMTRDCNRISFRWENLASHDDDNDSDDNDSRQLTGQKEGAVEPRRGPCVLCVDVHRSNLTVQSDSLGLKRKTGHETNFVL